MLFSRRLPVSSLIELCRVLRHNLGAGISLVKVFRQQVRRGSVAVRPLAERISLELERGESLEVALQAEKKYFPPLFLALAGVGEHTGNLPEIFGELEKYYILQQKLWRQFLVQIWWPVFQFVAATLVIAALIFIMGIINEGKDPLGIGLTGAGGSPPFPRHGLWDAGGPGSDLPGVNPVAAPPGGGGPVPVAAAGFWVVPACPGHDALLYGPRVDAGNRHADRGCPAASAYWLPAMQLLPPGRKVLLSACAGDDLTVALAASGLFGETFQNILAVAEESGRVPEVMRHQAEYYEEEAGRRLAVLTRVAGTVVWMVVAGFIIIAIFLIFSGYLQAINNFL